MTDVSKMASGRLGLGAVALIITVIASSASAAESSYYGKHIGKLKQLHHGLGGDVYAVDARTLHIRDFTYDGEGPAAYFYISNSKTPSGNGVRINDEKGTQKVLKRYRKEHITLTLPEGKTLNNIKWFYVWCDEFSVNFGDVKIPKGLGFPKPHKLESLSGIHGVSSDAVVIVDAQTMLVPNFSYDGEAPDAKFWVGTGSKPNSQGWKVADENGKEVPLRRYDHKTIVLTLPGDMTVFDIGHFGVWCEAFAVDFGHVKIPKSVNVPPSLKMLGVSPQKRPRSLHFTPEQSRIEQPLEPSSTQQRHQLFGEESAQYQVTTYKPFYRPRDIDRADDAIQIIPSISLHTNNFFGQQQYYPQQTQQSNVFIRRNDYFENGGDPYRANFQRPIYQQPYDINNRHDGQSFSRVSFNGAGGQTNTFIRY